MSLKVKGEQIRAQVSKDLSPIHRKFQNAWVMVRTEAQRSQLTVEAVLTATMQSRKLTPGAATEPVPPLPALYREEYTKPTRFYDFDTPEIRAWIREHGLTQQKTETTLAFAYRAFRAVQARITYGFPIGKDTVHTFCASTVAAQLHGDCLGSNALFGAVLRANKIPYRNMGGRWSYSNTTLKETENNHSRSEFWCAGIGWVPVDATAPPAAGITKEQLASKFGQDTGDFFAIHEDLDYIIPVIHHPDLTLGWFHYYAVLYGQDQNPLANGAEVRQTWAVREIKR